MSVLEAERIDELLDSWPVGRLATQGDEGPRQFPVVFACTREPGPVLWTPVDGKPKSGRELARVRDLRARPRASLLLDAYHDDWSRLWWLRIDVDARVIRPAEPSSDARVAAALAALERKYPQYERVPVLGEPPTLIELRPRAMRSWSA